MKRNTTQLLIGICMVVFGGALLLERMHLLRHDTDLIWALILTVGGLIFAGTGIAEGRGGRTFIGSWAFLYGLFLVMRMNGMIMLFPHVQWFAMMLSLALSFFLLFILNPRNFGTLVSAAFIGVFAMWIYYASTNVALADDIGGFMRVYWPLALILFGVNALLRGTQMRKNA